MDKVLALTIPLASYFWIPCSLLLLLLFYYQDILFSSSAKYASRFDLFHMVRKTYLDHPLLSIIHAVSFFYIEISPPKTKFILSPPLNVNSMRAGLCFISMLGDCVVFSVLSHHSKDLKGGTELHLCYSSVLFGKKSIVYPQGVRACQPQMRGSILAPLFVCFVSSSWACPM